MNIFLGAGRLGADGDLRATPSGQSVVNFDLACRKVRGVDNETLWVRCSLWGERAQKLAPYLKKGGFVTVVGIVDQRTYESKQEQKTKAQMTCNVIEIDLQGSSVGSAPSGGQPRAETKPGEVRGSATGGEQGDFDDDIPF